MREWHVTDARGAVACLHTASLAKESLLSASEILEQITVVLSTTRKKKQLQSATADCMIRHNPSQCSSSRIASVVCMPFVFRPTSPRHKVVKVSLRKARRYGPRTIARRRCAERSELLRFSVAMRWLLGAGSGALCCQVLIMTEERGMRENGERSATWRERWNLVCQVVASSL